MLGATTGLPMSEKREPTPSVRIVALLMGLTMTAFCGYFLISGLITGRIVSLAHRDPGQLVAWQVDPAYFLFICFFHAFLLVLGLGLIRYAIKRAPDRKS